VTGKLHALLIGVSAYPNLPDGATPMPFGYGMRQLSASAVSAYRLSEWLHEAAARLNVTLAEPRLLLSPAPGELPALSPDQYRPATREQIRRELLAWRRDCRTARENVAFFYFAGHGIQQSRADAVLLPEDFGDDEGNPLYNAITVSDLVEGMAPTEQHPEIARTQLWFIDACRVLPDEFDDFATQRVAGIFEATKLAYDDRSAPIFNAAVPGGSAYTVPGETTIFNEALLECLRGRAGIKRSPGAWAVTVGSLIDALPQVVRELNAKYGGVQEVRTGGDWTGLSQPLVRLARPPAVPVRIQLTPADVTRLSVTRSADGVPMVVPSPLEPNPFEDSWVAGSYQAVFTPACAGLGGDELFVLPPSYSLSLPGGG
jgi:hypothetical protein